MPTDYKIGLIKIATDVIGKHYGEHPKQTMLQEMAADYEKTGLQEEAGSIRKRLESLKEAPK